MLLDLKESDLKKDLKIGVRIHRCCIQKQIKELVQRGQLVKELPPNLEGEQIYFSKLMTNSETDFVINNLPPLRGIHELYNTAEQEYSAEEFHKCCNNLAPLLLVCRSVSGYIFGAYVAVAFTSPKTLTFQTNTKNKMTSFLFSASKHTLHYLNPGKNEICSGSQLGPCFANKLGEFDLFIPSLQTQYGSSNLGHAYELPPTITSGSIEAHNYLAGETKFRIQTYEVYMLYL